MSATLAIALARPASSRFGLERAVERQRLDQRRVIFARRVAHQRAHPPGMVDQRLAGPCPMRGPSAVSRTRPSRPGVDEIFVERGIVLQIDFGAAAGDLVERRLGDEEVPVLDQLRHLPVEEGQQQGADVGAVDVGVGHDHDLVIAQLLEVELLARRSTCRAPGSGCRFPSSRASGRSARARR